MAHSVAKHLSVTASTYDVEIRRFIPGYDAMLDEVASTLREHGGADHILDLGAGTGALTQRIAAELPAARFTLIDADPDMLAQARARLADEAGRITFSERSFTGALPACDAVVASFALHHVHHPAEKLQLFRDIRAALAPGGVLVIADAMLPDTGPLAEPLRRRWAAHLVAHGDSEAQAHARFADWAKEDRYFGIDVELLRLAAAGFGAVDVRWRLGPVAVVTAHR